MDWFLLAFISAFLSAAAAIAQKKILFDLSALHFSFVLSLFNVVFSLPLIFTFQFAEVHYVSLIILFIKSIFGAIAFLCVMLAIKNMEISGALPLLVLTPGLVAIASFFLLSETLAGIEIWGVVLLLSGTYILEMKGGRKFLDPFKVFINSRNHYYILGALFLFTLTSVLDKVLLTRYSLEPKAFLLFQHIFHMVIFFAIVLVKDNPLSILRSVSKINFSWIVLVAVLTLGYRYTQLEAFKIAPIALVLAVKRISVLFATILGGKIFREHNLIKKAIAVTIMIIGAILVY